MRDAAARAMAGCGDTYFTIDPISLFGRRAPLEIEIGAGRGDFIVARAAAMPQRNFLAVELAGAIARLMAVRAGRANLENLRIVRMDARPLVNLFLPRGIVNAYHIYFPDPWPKARHSKHRLFTPWFAAGLARTLVAGAPLYVATDVPEYAEAIFSMVEVQGFRRAEIPVPGTAETAFARKFIAEGKRIHSGAFVI